MFYKLRARVTHVKYTEINLMDYSLSTEIAKVSNCCYLMTAYITRSLSCSSPFERQGFLNSICSNAIFVQSVYSTMLCCRRLSLSIFLNHICLFLTTWQQHLKVSNAKREWCKKRFKERVLKKKHYIYIRYPLLIFTRA